MRKVRQTRCLQVLYSLGLGGAESTVISYLKNVPNEKVAFDFLVHKKIEDGYEQQVLDSGTIIFTENMRSVGPFKYIRNLRELIELNGPYDIVHIHMDAMNGFVAFAARMAGVKCIICHSHSAGIRSVVGRAGIIVCRILIQISGAKRVACGADAGKALFGNMDFEVINNGIDTSYFECLTNRDAILFRRKENIPENAIVITHVGRFDDAKNQKFAIEVADFVIEQNEHAVFVFVGDGVTRKKCEEQAASLHSSSRVLFLGLRRDVPLILYSSNIFIMPSVYEGLPVTLLEAQCVGLPCFVSDLITKEADCGFCDVQYLPLDVNLWAKEVISTTVTTEKKDMHASLQAIKRKGFDVRDNIGSLLTLYEMAEDES